MSLLDQLNTFVRKKSTQKAIRSLGKQTRRYISRTKKQRKAAKAATIRSLRKVKVSVRRI